MQRVGVHVRASVSSPLLRVAALAGCSWQVTFLSVRTPVTVPFMAVKFADSATGSGRAVSVSRVQAAEELVAPLPASLLQVPLSYSSSVCSGFGLTVPVYDRSLSLPVVVRVRGRPSSCELDVGASNDSQRLCTASVGAADTPVVLSVFPSLRKLCATTLDLACYLPLLPLFQPAAVDVDACASPTLAVQCPLRGWAPMQQCVSL